MRLFLALALATALASLAAAQPPARPVPRTPASTSTPAGRPGPRPAAPARREAIVPFRVGETLTYDVSWSQFLTAGTAVVKVVEKKPSFGSSAYHLVADGRPLPLVERFYPVYYKMDSLLDSFTAYSQWTSIYTEERGRTRQANTRFDRAARKAFYEVPADPSMKDTFSVPPDVQDGLATLYAIRGRAFKDGERFAIPVADDGAMYTVAFQTSGPTRVRVPIGDIEAWELQVTIVDTKGQPFATSTAIWISTDARRLPVKMQANLSLGSFVLALRDVQP